jgi:hypothetical protein
LPPTSKVVPRNTVSPTYYFIHDIVQIPPNELSKNLQSREKRQKDAIKEWSPAKITDIGKKLIIEPVPKLLDEVGRDKGKYDPAKIKKMLDESKKHWR